MPEESETEAVMKQFDQRQNAYPPSGKRTSPVNVEGNGISIAIDELCRSAEQIYAIRCVAECDEIVIRTIQKRPIFIISYRESLNNAVKHGKSKNIKIILKRNGTGIACSIIDDGIGFTVRDGKREGLGLTFMKYRADIIGGMLSITSGKPSGTIVTCMIETID